jgi:1,4-dihydroxy-2-naphthoyl-CoA hydrolase
VLTLADLNNRGSGRLPGYLGKTTHVWDALVTHKETGKTIALFRCTQLILYPR